MEYVFDAELNLTGIEVLSRKTGRVRIHGRMNEKPQLDIHENFIPGLSCEIMRGSRENIYFARVGEQYERLSEQGWYVLDAINREARFNARKLKSGSVVRHVRYELNDVLQKLQLPRKIVYESGILKIFQEN
ncbi:MAG TPA: hypothetical protein DEB39_07800 [Planctomycetaceae bacterium]|nr:hypothetical protein [Planctomycetaceae bacterium]